MKEESGERADARHKSEADPHKKGIAGPNRFKIDREFIANHEASIILAIAGAIFISPINDFMNQKAKVWAIGVGIWCFVGIPIAWVCRSITANMRPLPSRPPTPATHPAATSPISARTTQTSATKERTILKYSLDELAAICDGLRPSEFESRTAPYIGKWLEFSQTFEGLVDLRHFLSVLTISTTPKYSVHLFFRPQWGDRLISLKHGDQIKVRGQIYKMWNDSLSFDNCELLEPQ